jgi:oligopeptidase B
MDEVRRLQAEHAALVPDDESDLPVYLRGYWYETRYAKGAEHPIYLRRKAVGDSEEVLFDAAAAAIGCPAYSVGTLDVSHDGALLAVTEDRLGSREYQLRLVDRNSGTELPEVITGIDPDVVFLEDRSVIYIAQDPVTLLGNRVMRHVPGSPVETDQLLHQEDDDKYTISVERSRSGRFVLVQLQSTLTTEVRYLRWDDANFELTVASARREGHEYTIEDDGDCFVIRTNDDAPDFRLMCAPIGQISDRSTWREILPARPGIVLTDCVNFSNALVAEERVGGLLQLRIIDRRGNTHRVLRASEPAASLWLDTNADSSVEYLRYAWGSLVQPTVRERFNFADGATQALRTDPVGGNYRSGDYEVQRRMIAARDGVEIPVTLVRRKNVISEASAPLLLTAYGAYGVCYPTSFDRTILPLVNRGVIYAIAHVRGGGELGRHWYDAGRLQHKRNTFEDFIDVRRGLAADGAVDGSRCAAVGASAGGLLMGVIANEAPTEFCAIVAHVPFVDILTTMLDEDLPLTTLEYEEWGHPGEDALAYQWMLAYSPYDNLRSQAYPAVLATGALHDSQVQYWECAKWVAQMRRCQTSDAPILLHMHLEAGHAGATGRFGAHQDIALEQAFLLDRLNALSIPL